MLLEELNEARNIKIEDLEHFKKIVAEAIEKDFLRWKKFGSWLYDEYIEYKDSEIYSASTSTDECGKRKQYRAIVIVMNDCYNKDSKQFHINNRDIYSVTIFDVFYTNICGGGVFISEKIKLSYDAIKSFERLFKCTKEHRKRG